MLAAFDRKQSCTAEDDRQMTPFSKTTIPFLDIDKDTVAKALGHRDHEADHQLFFVPGGRFVIVLSSSFYRLTVIDLERYFDKRSKGETDPLLTDYTASVECRSTSGILRTNLSPDGTTLLIISSKRRPDWYFFFCSWFMCISCLRQYSAIGCTNFRFGSMNCHLTRSTWKRRPPFHLVVHPCLRYTTCSQICWSSWSTKCCTSGTLSTTNIFAGKSMLTSISGVHQRFVLVAS